MVIFLYRSLLYSLICFQQLLSGSLIEIWPDFFRFSPANIKSYENWHLQLKFWPQEVIEVPRSDKDIQQGLSGTNEGKNTKFNAGKVLNRELSKKNLRWLSKNINHYRTGEMVFCYQNCSDLLWEKTVLVIKIFFWNSRLKAESFQNFWDH